MDNNQGIEVTEAMVRAGLHTVLYEYGNKFDAMENDAEHFVTRIFEATHKAQPQSDDQAFEVSESKP